MAVIATFSKYKKTNYKIAIAILVAAAIYFAYDGYFNQKFIDKHSLTGEPDGTLVFNRKSPPFLLAGGVAMAVCLFVVGGRKVVADENELIISEKEKIAYDSIEAIDKSNYESKGVFVITYKDSAGSEVQRKLSDKTYDNLNAVLDVLVAKITA